MKQLVLSIALLLLVAGCAQSGKDGATGSKGLPGNPGDTGPQGPGTVITLVQFCPNGPAPVYPTVFPEYGFCINGNLYATYSANDGFTTMILPGTYSSNAIGSNCTFVVGPNCSITQQ